MKVLFRYIIAILIVGAIAGYVLWQKNKKEIFKASIQSAIQKKTDSLYYLQYDSSIIDEANGNASFYMVRLQSDSMQKSMLKHNDSLPNALFNISIKQVTARGIDIAAILQKKIVTAKSIKLINPVIQIINTGLDKPKPYTYEDTLALYQKLTGRFKGIYADTILLLNGTVLITDKKGTPLTTIENINISLTNFLIDSTRNYQHIISYFIKDVKATVENIQLPENKNAKRINITNLLYDAPQKLLQIGTIQQYRKGNSTPLIDLKNIKVTELNTDAFIKYRQLKAGPVICDGGLITLYKKKKKNRSGNEAIEMSAELIDEVHIGSVKLGHTKVIVLDAANPNSAPLIINNVTFSASKVERLSDGSTINNLINNANWELMASGFSFYSKEKMYLLNFSGIKLNNKEGNINIKQLSVKPLLSETIFFKRSKVQTDRFDMLFSNINLKVVNFKKLINENILDIKLASLQPVIKIFNDRTLPVDSSIIIVQYPHQSLLDLVLPFYIEKIAIFNGDVSYKEKAKKTVLTGIVNFTKINAQIFNVTNIPSKIKENNILSLKATTQFLGISTLKTEWQLPLNSKDTTFTVVGKLEPMDASALNKILEPLAMASVSKGKINKLTFNLKCTNYKTNGRIEFLYNNLKVKVLKMSEDTLKKKVFISLLANKVIKNDNPSNSNTYISNFDYKRDIQKSFFNLLWKSIFEGVKKTLIRK